MGDELKSSYFSEWFQAVPGKWYSLTLILIALVGSTAAGIIWVSKKGLEWWWIVLYAFIIVLFIILNYIAYKKVAKERDTAIEDKERFFRELMLVKEQDNKIYSRPTDPAQGEAYIDSSPLDFSVNIENIRSIQEIILSDTKPKTMDLPPRLLVKISFRTNKIIQIASLHLEIEPKDPRDIIELDPDMVQGFTIPYMLYKSETYQFQFERMPKNIKGEHALELKVLAGGYWYSSGIHKINL